MPVKVTQRLRDDGGQSEVDDDCKLGVNIGWMQSDSTIYRRQPSFSLPLHKLV